MANIKFKLANTSDFSNNFASILLGKNGFETTFGSIPLLANTISVVNPTSARPNGNLRFTVVGFNQLHDYNFDKHILAVNDTAFQAASGFVKGFDFVQIPLVDKTADISPENGILIIFPAYLLHSATPYIGEKDRLVVSFNSVINQREA